MRQTLVVYLDFLLMAVLVVAGFYLIASLMAVAALPRWLYLLASSPRPPSAILLTFSGALDV
jgi:hypothetical protein